MTLQGNVQFKTKVLISTGRTIQTAVFWKERTTNWKCQISKNVTIESQSLKDNVFTLAFRIGLFMLSFVLSPVNIYWIPTKHSGPCFVLLVLVSLLDFNYFSLTSVQVWVCQLVSALISPCAISNARSRGGWLAILPGPSTEAASSAFCHTDSNWHKKFAL